MKFLGKLQSISRDWKSGKPILSFLIDEGELDGFDGETGTTQFSLEVKKHVKRRSLDANALFWACLSELAMHEKRDKWDLYLEKLKRHGKCYPNTVITEGLADLKATWREVEEVATRVDEYGTSWTTVLLYPGSHLYTTEEFSKLLDDVIEDMKADGLQPPTSEEMRRSLEIWEKSHIQH